MYTKIETSVLKINGDIKNGRVEEAADVTLNQPDVPKYIYVNRVVRGRTIILTFTLKIHYSFQLKLLPSKVMFERM
jgi:hypothetical protein